MRDFGQTIAHFAIAPLRATWYLDYATLDDPPRPGGIQFVQTIRYDFDPTTVAARLGPTVDANPGSLWLIGNEPDRQGFQDDRLPDEYAQLYHGFYSFIKQRDPNAQVAIGAVVQPTPLRLQYLDLILQAYRARYGTMIPVDVWNIHNMILREEAGSWGAGIPPGMTATQGRLYEVQDNDSLPIFRQQIRAFRQWMADHGERNKPLIVSEYGVLMPDIYGFDHARVRTFMLATFDYLMTASDSDLGFPPDADRLVQRWAWYSLNDQMYDPETGQGFNGNLFDPSTRQMTLFGLDYAGYTARFSMP